MANMNECLLMLRRRIGDTEEPYVFSDSLLMGYVEDAVAQVEMDYKRGITLNSNVFVEDIEPTDVVLFTIKAHYLIKLRTKDKADRDNFLMKKGRLTLDNTGQAKDHADTLDLINKEYVLALTKVKNGGSSFKGVRME